MSNTRLMLSVLATVMMSASANAQSYVQEDVQMRNYDQGTDTYTAYITISGNPCPNSQPSVGYNVTLGVPGAKTPHDALDKDKGQINKIVQDMVQDHNKCAAGGH